MLKSRMINTLVYTALLLAVATGCQQSAKNEESQLTVAKPEIDLQTAVISGNLVAVKQHIEAGSELNEKETFTGATPLITAATFDKREIAKALIEGGADLSAINGDGGTALHAAAFFCRVEIVQMLLDAKADKNTRNKYGATARESIVADFAQVKPIYNMMKQQLAPMGLELDLAMIEKTRPVIAMMLQ